MTPDELSAMKVPRSYDDVKAVASVVSKYKDEHFLNVLAGFVSLYLFMQSFAIPGCIFLSVLGGAIFGVPLGLLIVSCVASCGASCCYLISLTLASDLVKRRFPDKLARSRAMIDEHRHNLFFYLLFLRATPMMPNWFINLSSPHVGVPLRYFFFATMFGLIPANFLHVTTGQTLATLGGNAPIDWKNTIFLSAFGFIALIPTLCRSKTKVATAVTEPTQTVTASPVTVSVDPEIVDLQHRVKALKKKSARSSVKEVSTTTTPRAKSETAPKVTKKAATTVAKSTLKSAEKLPSVSTPRSTPRRTPRESTGRTTPRRKSVLA
jgi:uncharacterized membrane protein YdjX (TVP38/TMEM64 family)